MENNKSKDKSVKVIKFELAGRKYKLKIMNAIKVMFFASAIIAIMAKGTSLAVEYVKTNNFLEESEYLVEKNAIDTEDNLHHYYDNVGIAKGLLEDPINFDKNLYGVFREISYNQGNRKIQMNEIIQVMRYDINKEPEKYQGFVAYDSFDDYLIKNGHVDKKGKPSVKKYDEFMKKYILLLIEQSEGKETDGPKLG